MAQRYEKDVQNCSASHDDTQKMRFCTIYIFGKWYVQILHLPVNFIFCKLLFVSKTGIRKFCDYHYYANFAYYFAHL